MCGAFAPVRPDTSSTTHTVRLVPTLSFLSSFRLFLKVEKRKEKNLETKIKKRSKIKIPAVDKIRSKEKVGGRGVMEWRVFCFQRLDERRGAGAVGSVVGGCEPCPPRVVSGWCRNTKSMRRISIWSDGNERKRSLCVPTSWRR